MHKAITNQYLAVLKMMDKGVEICPDIVWYGKDYKHRTWHIAYHSLFFMDLYSSPSLKDFKPWERHIEDYHSLGPMIEKGGALPVIGLEYSKNDVREYIRILTNVIPGRISGLVMTDPSVFPWLPMNKYELHLYNIRHVQHHMGQLNERIGDSGSETVGWVISGG